MAGKSEILERESRTARTVAIITLAGALLFVISAFGQPLVGLSSSGSDAEQLRDFHDHASALLALSVLSAIALPLMTPGLVYLLNAARARNQRVRREMVGFVFIGFGILAVSIILGWVARHDAANVFVQHVAGHKHPSDYASNLLDDSGTGKTAAALVIPAILGIVISMIYIPLQAMRVGLLTRFWGTLGMALGAAFLVLGPVAMIFVAVWNAYLAMLIGGWMRGGRPPAWASGEAMPWPKPGEDPASPAGDPAARGSGAEQAAGSDVVEGEGKPVPRQPGERRKRKRRQAES